jgi:predicted phosphodiesterase
MLIQYVSDIHLEFMTKVPKIKVMADILCLAGDIGYPFSGIYKDFLISMNKTFKKIFLIAGNHEYYMMGKNTNRSMDEINTMIVQLIKIHNLTNVSFLNNSSELYNDYLFVGTTLWTKISSMNMNDIAQMNDFRMIKTVSNGSLLSYDAYNLLHIKNRNFIENTLATNINKNKIIMITHHLPSFKLIAEEYQYSDINCFYASECDKFFVEPIVAWIYGHTHTPNTTVINGIQFVCNPKGYPTENHIIKFVTIEV